MRKHAPLVIALGGICFSGAVQAQESDAPDLDFLEYLGSWQAEDDEWLVIEEWQKDNAGKDEEQDSNEGEGERE